MKTNLISVNKGTSLGFQIREQFNSDVSFIKNLRPRDLTPKVDVETKDLEILIADRRIKQYKKNEIVFSSGDNTHYIYFLSKGKVKTFKVHACGKELVTGLFKEGDFFGYNALIEEKPYSEMAETFEDSEICMIPKEDFLSLINKNPYVLMKFTKILSNNIVKKEEQLINLAYSSMRKRVAVIIVLLQKTYYCIKNASFNIPLSRIELARIIGTSPESIIRTLSEFKREKLIEIRGRNIVIIDLERLEKLKD